MRRTLRLFAALGPCLWSSAARACTVCDSAAGHQLRAGLFNGHFLHTLLITGAPVPFLIAAVFLLYAGFPDFTDAQETAALTIPAGPELAA